MKNHPKSDGKSMEMGSRGRLGRVPAPLWHQPGARDEKLPKKGTSFSLFLTHFWDQNRSQTATKRSEGDFGSIFCRTVSQHRFWDVFVSIWDPLEPPKPCFFIVVLLKNRGSTIPEKRVPRDTFWLHFGSNLDVMGRICGQKGAQEAKKGAPGADQKKS